MKKLLLLLIFFSYQSHAVEIDTPEKFYSSREPYRKEYAASVQKTIDGFDSRASTKAMLERSIAAAGSDGTNVTQTGSASSTVSDGSKVTGSGSVTKKIDAAAVAKATVGRLEKAKALGKATLPGFLGSAALTGLIAGVGWIMDEGGKVTKPFSPTNCNNPSSCPTSSKLYKYGNNFYHSGQSACDAFLEETKNTWGKTLPTVTFKSDQCLLYGGSNNYNGNVGAAISSIVNTAYDPSASPQSSPVADTDLEKAISDHITNNTTNNNITNNIVNNAYSYDSSNGATSSDATNSLATDAANDIANETTKAATATSGGTSTTISNGKTVTATVNADTSAKTESDSTSTTTNPDGSTSTTTGTGTAQMQLPAFCTWASIVCDFINWVKEEPEVDKPEVPFQEIEQREIQDDLIKAGGSSCPSDINANFSGMPFGISINKTVEMQPYCNALEPLKYVFQLMTMILCVFLLARL